MKGKILVKAKKIRLTATGSIETDVEDEEQEFERNKVNRMSLREVFQNSQEVDILSPR